MKRLAFVFVFLSIAACTPNGTGKTIVYVNDPTLTSTHLRAVYLIQGQAKLSSSDLQAHPEIVVVHTFNQFKQYAHQKVALWIDRSAVMSVTFEQREWFNEAPQAYYPLALIGSNDAWYAFKRLLGLCCFLLGPINDEGVNKAEAGFSVIQREETNEHEPRSPAVTFMEAYDQNPTAQSILAITNALLEGRLKATPTATFFPAGTPTRAP